MTSIALTIRRAGHAPTDLVTTTDDLRAILDRADAANELLAALTECLALIDDMARFVGKMSLRNYQRFNEAPMAARAAIAKAEGRI